VTVASALPPPGMGSEGHVGVVQPQLAAAMVMVRGDGPVLRMRTVAVLESPSAMAPKSTTSGSNASPAARGPEAGNDRPSTKKAPAATAAATSMAMTIGRALPGFMRKS
jgi:hypothetical protein